MSISSPHAHNSVSDIVVMPVLPPVPTSLEQLPPPISESGHSHKFLKKAGAAVVGAALFATSYLTTREVEDHVSPDASAMALSVGDAYHLPVTESIPQSKLQGEIGRVDRDLRNALSVDTCETKVTPNEALGMYQRLFGPDSGLNANPGSLMSETDQALSRLQEAGKKFTFGHISSDEYIRLQKDADAQKPKLPLSEYRKVVDDYMAQLGLKTVYSWDPSKSGAPNSDLIKPVDNLATHTDVMARKAMMGAISGFANVSRELIAESGAKRVVFGDITGDNALGEVLMGEHDILIDTVMFKDGETNGMNSNYSLMRITSAHENTHLLHYSLCWELMNRAVGSDNAMRVLNAGNVYTDDLKKSSAPKQAITLETDSAGAIISARSYGQQNDLEDTATEGEIAFSAENAHMLFEHDNNPKQDVTPLREKFALLLARMEKKNPAVADYYVDLLQAGRVEAFVESQVSPLYDQMNKIYSNNPNLPNLPSSDPAAREYAQLQKQAQPYQDIKSKIDSVMYDDGVQRK